MQEKELLQFPCDFPIKVMGYSDPEFVGTIGRLIREFDPLFEEVAEYVVKRAEVSVSDLQRKFAVGYCRGCRIMEQLESAGIVSPETRKQSVLVKGKKELDKILSEINRP